MKTRHYAFLLFAVACATHSIKETKPTPKTAEAILKPRPVTVLEPIEVKPKTWKLPHYNVMAVGRDLSTYHAAINHIKTHGNSDEFYAFMAKKRKYFAHSLCKVEECIKQFREQLDRGDQIDIVFYTPFWKSNSIGGWDGSKIHQNTKFVLNDIERAGHLLHETSHKYGWTHVGNYATRNDNENSFSYAVGYDFEEFLTMKFKQVAAQ